MTNLLLQGLKNKRKFTAEMVEAYKYVFSQPGALTAPINYYRCLFNQRGEKKGAPNAIETPTLVIWVSRGKMYLVVMTTYTMCSPGGQRCCFE